MCKFVCISVYTHIMRTFVHFLFIIFLFFNNTRIKHKITPISFSCPIILTTYIPINKITNFT